MSDSQLMVLVFIFAVAIAVVLLGYEAHLHNDRD